MLVLSRKIGESIMVGDNIKVEVCRIGPNTVRIGIAAPPEMNIARTELLVVEQPEHGSSQDDARTDCEGHEAPFYSSTPANKKTIDRLRAFAESLQRANKESDVGLDSIRELPQIHW